MENNMDSPKSSAPRMAPWLKNPSTLSNVSGSPPSRTQTEGVLAVNPSFQKTHAKKMSAEVHSTSSNSPPASPTTKRRVITEVLHSPTLELVCPELRVSRQFEGEVVNHMDRCVFDVGYYWDQSAEEIEVRVYQQINSNKHKAIPPSAYAAEEGQRRKELLAQKIEARRREEEEENLRKKRLEDEMKKREEEAQRKKEEDEKKAAEDERKKAEDERKKQEQESKKPTGGRRVSLTEFPPRRTDSMASDERYLSPSCPIEADSFSLDKTSSGGSAEYDFDKMSQKDLEFELEKSYIPTRWRAISSYTAKEKKGLSFKEGEVLKVLRRGGGVFWLAEAEKGGARGLVPGYFLEEVEEEKVPGVVIKRKDGKKSLKKKKQRDNALQPRSSQNSKKDRDPPGSPVVMEVPNVQPASAAAKGRFGAHWMKGKKDKKDKKEKEKKTTLVNWDNLIIGETLSKISAGSGTSIHVCYVDGFQCCMKELNFMVATAQQKRMIRGEIELLESLEPHRNVIRYLHHEEGKTYIRLFLTMYSATLSDLLKKRKDANSPLSAIDICFYCRLCLDGLQFLHGHGIIHRDIKAENVFLILGANGKVLEVALGDFDQAKNLGGGMTVTTIGTVGWMAPEMLVGQGYSFPADIYSFGMLLYEMLSLTIPFEKESQFTLPDKVRKGLTPTIPEEVVDLPGYPELIALQRECIAVEPSERPHLPVLQQRFGEIFGRLLEETEKNSQQAL